jgi:uncharacterized protein
MREHLADRNAPARQMMGTSPGEITLAPTAGSERIAALDALRGMAILGVLVAYTVWNLGNPPFDTWSSADRAVARGMDLFVDNKFLTIFAWLFGVGVAQQWRRWEAAQSNPVALHVRRMLFLAAIGLAHATLLRNGDILAPYALLGFTLVAFRRRTTRTLWACAVVLAAVPYGVQAAAAATGWRFPARPDASAAGYVVENLMWVRYWYLTNTLLSWPRILAVMLAGMLAGRARTLERMATEAQLARRVLAVSVPLAMLTRYMYDTLLSRWSAASSLPHGITLDVFYQTSAWTLAAVYTSGLVLASQSDVGAACLSPLRSLGRMAFTNYLAQAILIVPFCLAFGLFDRITPTRGMWIAAVVGVLQIGFSTWWLSGHSMGPFERLWRETTYGSGVRTPARIA